MSAHVSPTGEAAGRRASTAADVADDTKATGKAPKRHMSREDLLLSREDLQAALQLSSSSRSLRRANSSESLRKTHSDGAQSVWRHYIANPTLLRGFGPQYVPTSHFRSLLLDGVPASLRPQVWMTFSGAQRQLDRSPGYFEDTLVRYSRSHSYEIDEIHTDLKRSFPEGCDTEERTESLRRVLTAYCWRNPSVGYCQSMNFIVAFLLLHCGEERAFWLMKAVAETILPDYYNDGLTGVMVDIEVFVDLVHLRLPAVRDWCAAARVDLHTLVQLLATQWFLCLFVHCVPLETTMRIWDCFFVYGPMVLMRVGLVLLQRHHATFLQKLQQEERLTSIEDGVTPQKKKSASGKRSAAPRVPGFNIDVTEVVSHVRESIRNERKEQWNETLRAVFEDEFACVLPSDLERLRQKHIRKEQIATAERTRRQQEQHRISNASAGISSKQTADCTAPDAAIATSAASALSQGLTSNSAVAPAALTGTSSMSAIATVSTGAPTPPLQSIVHDSQQQPAPARPPKTSKSAKSRSILSRGRADQLKDKFAMLAEEAASLAADTHFSQDEVALLQKDFILLELPSHASSSTLSCSQFVEIMLHCVPLWNNETIPLELLFRAFTSSGHFGFSQLVFALSCITRGPLLERLRMVFDIFDDDRDGVLDRDAVGRFLILTHKLQAHDQDTMDHVIQIIFANMDTDGDGLVKFDEFATGCRSDPAILSCLSLSADRIVPPEHFLDPKGMDKPAFSFSGQFMSQRREMWALLMDAAVLREQIQESSDSLMRQFEKREMLADEKEELNFSCIKIGKTASYTM